MKKVNPKPSLLKNKRLLNGFKSFNYSISRESVEDGNISKLVKFLKDISENDYIEISVSGYGDDPRELENIQEVRKFFTKVDREVPNLYEKLKISSIHLIALCVYGGKLITEKNGKPIYDFDGESFYKRVGPEICNKLFHKNIEQIRNVSSSAS